MTYTVQYRVALGKKQEAVEGPDDADVMIAVDAKDALLDPSVAYMLGRLKAVGHTGALFDVLSSGEAADALRRLTPTA